MKEKAKILEELAVFEGGGCEGRMYKIQRSTRKKSLKITGPDGVGVIIREDVLDDLGNVAGVPDIEDHPRGILFTGRWSTHPLKLCSPLQMLPWHSLGNRQKSYTN